MYNIPIFLLHGLGCHPVILYPMENYLNKMGYTNTYAVPYNPDKKNIEEVIEEVDKKIMERADKEKDEIILIGQSMGGVISNNLHKKGWRIKKAVYIGSPLHGAKMVNIVESWIPNTVLKWFRSPAWETLSQKSIAYQNGNKEEEPPHDYHTISMGWWDTSWDSRVFMEETMLDPKKHTHLEGEDHCLVFTKKRLWELVHDIIKKD